jgi:hypothetical protein
VQKEAILRRLVLAKYLLRLGRDEARKPEPLCSAAVLLFHDSVELVLALAAEHHNVGSKKTEFAQYFALLESAIAPTKLSHRESMRRLNDARVSLKHHGTPPSRRDILSFEVATTDFVTENLPILFGISLNDVTLADLVSAEEVRECLHRADKALSDKDAVEASCAIAEAFARLLKEFQVSSRSGRGMRSELRDLESQFDRSGRVGALTHLAEAVDALHEETALLRQGVDTRMLTVFRSLTPDCLIAMAGNARFSMMGGAPPPTLDQMQFCYDFVIDSALRMQDLHLVVSELISGRYLHSRFGRM